MYDKYLLYILLTFVLCGCSNRRRNLEKSKVYTFINDSTSLATDIASLIDDLYNKYDCEFRIFIFTGINCTSEEKQSLYKKVEHIIKSCSVPREKIIIATINSSQSTKPFIRVIPKFVILEAEVA